VTDATPPEEPEAPRARIPYLNEPQRDLGAWVRYFSKTEIPVLASTSAAIEALRADEDNVDAKMLGSVIESDPFMTIKVMADVAARRKPGDKTDTETVTAALVMTGVSPFFRNFGLQPTVQDQLFDQPLAMEGLTALIKRTQRAAHFAMAFAVHRGDTDAGVIYQAAILHEFAEMLMWCHAPTFQLEIIAMQKANPTLRTAALQRFVYNVDLQDLGHALMTLWHLPELLIRICDGKHPDHPSVRNVVLASRLARHIAGGWDNPAVPDDIADISELLNGPPRVVISFLHKVDLGRE
jgi:HD-like signal output (HDOD) protein